MCVWTEDADVIRFGEKSLNIVYKNQVIKDFLGSNRIFGISGTKGQGKTFLLKVKRSNFQGKIEEEEDESCPITCLPMNMMTDTLDNAITNQSLNNKDFIVNKSLNSFLKDYKVWVQMWKISIAVTIITSKNFSHLYTDKDYKYLNRISKNLLSLSNPKSRPCIVFSHLFDLNIKDFTIILQDANYFIHLLDKINSAVYIFIDKVEQAFSADIEKYASQKKTIYQQNISYWQYAQYSLADASYQLFTFNTHIKVFYTIRHEALLDASDLTPNTCQNIQSYLRELVYTQEDIFEMFKIYIENEDDKNLCVPNERYNNPEKAFFGLDIINHAYVPNTNEKMFSYLYRHSLRRPRDVMAICRALYLKNPKNLTLQTIRHTINEISNSVLKNYLKEVAPFITCNDKEIYRLLKCMNTNFFDFNYIQYVCQRYNIYHTKSDKCHKNCRTCKNAHPFSTLYNIGLIGCLKNSLANPTYIQRFLPLGESKLKISEYDLPNSQLYCLHPCLCDVSRNSRNYMHHNFETCNEIICGEGILTPDDKISNIVNSLQYRIQEMDKEKIFISSTIYDLTKERDAIKKSLFKEGYYPVLSESDEFRYAPNDVDSHDHCIDELLKCNTMIFIIGEKYGGKYIGEDYKSYIEDIYNESAKNISEPSISLMEFYAAEKNNLNYYVFVKKDVIDQQRIYKNKKEKKEDITQDDFTCDIDIFKVVNFVNHIKKEGKRAGNWFLPFKSIPDLKTRLNQIPFGEV